MSFSIGFTPKKKFRLGSSSRPKLAASDAKPVSQVSRLINMFERSSKVHPHRVDSTESVGSLTKRTPAVQKQPSSVSVTRKHIQRSFARLWTPKAKTPRGVGVDEVMASDEVFEKNNNDACSPAVMISTPKLRLWSEVNSGVSDDYMFKF